MESILTFVSHSHWYNSPVNKPVLACLAKGTCTTCASKLRWRYKNLVLASLFIIPNNSKYLRVCNIYEPGPRTPTPPPLPPQWYPPPLLTPPTPQNLVFACYLHIYIHIYTHILPFPPLQPRISTLFAALESHDLVNGPCLPVYFYHNLFFEPPIACLAHGLQHICYLWTTQSLPMQT